MSEPFNTKAREAAQEVINEDHVRVTEALEAIPGLVASNDMVNYRELKRAVSDINLYMLRLGDALAGLPEEDA